MAKCTSWYQLTRVVPDKVQRAVKWLCVYICVNRVSLLVSGLLLHLCLVPHIHNHFMALWILSGITRVSRYQKKHSPTHTHCGHQSSLSASSIYYDPWHPPYSIHKLYSLFPQSLSKFSLVYLLAWHPPLHTPYISSPNHYPLFATHAHTIATCFAVVPRLCHLILVSLSTLLGTLSDNFTPHIHLTILISALWSATSFSFLTGQV